MVSRVPEGRAGVFDDGRPDDSGFPTAAVTFAERRQTAAVSEPMTTPTKTTTTKMRIRTHRLSWTEFSRARAACSLAGELSTSMV